jgi:hypothetical protein
MRKVIFLTVLALVVGGLSGGLAAQETGSISGTVSVAGTGAPIVGEWVIASAGDGYGDTYSGAGGSYLISNLPPGSYRVGAGYGIGPDYSEWALSFWPGVDHYDLAGMVEVVAGETTSGIDLELQLGGVVTGTITDSSTGRPVPDGFLSMYNYDEVRDRWYGAEGITVDTGGRFRLEGLNGTYRLEAQFDGYATVEREFTIDPEEEMTIDFALVASHPGSILGRLTEAATGDPISGQFVVASGTNGWSSTRSRSDGTYEIEGLPAGDYKVGTGNDVEVGEPSDWVRMWWPGVASYWDAEEVEVTEAAGATGIDFALVFGGVVEGTVTDAWTGQSLGPDWLSLFSYENGQWMGGFGYDFAADGKYRIGGLSGRYRLSVNLVDYLPIEHEFTIEPGEEVTVDFEVTPAWGTPFATVGGMMCEVPYDSGTCENMLEGVVVEARTPDGELLGTAITDEGGWYLLEELTPGEMVIAAVSPAGMEMLDAPVIDLGPNQGAWDVNLRARRLAAHLGMDSWVSPTEFEPGEQAELHLEAIFRSIVGPVAPFDLTGVEVEVFLPNGLEYVSHSGEGRYDHATGRWSIPVLGFLSREEMTITVTAEREGTFRPHAEIVASDWPDPAATFGDGRGDDFTTATFRVEAIPVVIEPATVAGRVWIDIDEDGVADEDEEGVTEVIVIARPDDGSEVTATSGSDGAYLFEGLPAGAYRISLDPETLPSDVEAPDDQTVQVGPGDSLGGVNFALVPVAGVSPWWWVLAGGLVVIGGVVAFWIWWLRREIGEAEVVGEPESEAAPVA